MNRRTFLALAPVLLAPAAVAPALELAPMPIQLTYTFENIEITIGGRVFRGVSAAVPVSYSLDGRRTYSEVKES